MNCARLLDEYGGEKLMRNISELAIA